MFGFWNGNLVFFFFFSEIRVHIRTKNYAGTALGLSHMLSGDLDRDIAQLFDCLFVLVVGLEPPPFSTKKKSTQKNELKQLLIQ